MHPCSLIPIFLFTHATQGPSLGNGVTHSGLRQILFKLIPRDDRPTSQPDLGKSRIEVFFSGYSGLWQIDN